jgi:hypothetical protein
MTLLAIPSLSQAASGDERRVRSGEAFAVDPQHRQPGAQTQLTAASDSRERTVNRFRSRTYVRARRWAAQVRQ